MKPKLLLCLALVLSGMIFSATRAKAQPGDSYLYHTSLEARIATAQAVFTGTISNFTRTVVSPPWTKWEKGQTGPQDGMFKYTFTVQVDEVIKGSPHKTAEFVTGDVFGGENDAIEQWAGQHTSFLWISGDTSWSLLGGNGSPWSTIRLGAAVTGQRDFSDDGPLYSMDGIVLSDPKEILAHARAFAQKRYSSTNTVTLDYLTIPVTPPLEKRAQQMVKSGNWDGEKALQFFKSAANIKLLKPLLNDPEYEDWQTQNVPWKTTRTYHVRQAAYDVLQQWGVQVAKPVTNENLPWYFDPAVRQILQVEFPTQLYVRGTTNLLEVGVEERGRSIKTTNVMTGSNMIVGVKFAWFVYPAGEDRPASASRLDFEYWPMATSDASFIPQRDGLPVPGRKYDVTMDFTLFETDNPPPEDLPLDAWRPQDGKNYRVLLERTLTKKSK